jgi:hypothetical protein
MIVIGVDVHKRSLTAVAVDEAGRMLDEQKAAGRIGHPSRARDGVRCEPDASRPWPSARPSALPNAETWAGTPAAGP